jgi:hypothetical protein
MVAQYTNGPTKVVQTAWSGPCAGLEEQVRDNNESSYSEFFDGGTTKMSALIPLQLLMPCRQLFYDYSCMLML